MKEETVLRKREIKKGDPNFHPTKSFFYPCLMPNGQTISCYFDLSSGTFEQKAYEFCTHWYEEVKLSKLTKGFISEEDHEKEIAVMQLSINSLEEENQRLNDILNNTL